MADVRKVVGLLVVALLAVASSLAQPAAADVAGDEAAFLGRLNELRAARGVAPLTPTSELTAVARTWSASMAAAGTISHNPSLASQGPPNWKRLGENVGVGMDVAGLHQAFVDSPSHYRNMVDGTFDSVGIGVVRGADTSIFVTVNFMTTKAAPVAAAPVAAPAPPPEPTPAPPRTAVAPAPAPTPVTTVAPAPVAAAAPVEAAPEPLPAPAPEPAAVLSSEPSPTRTLAGRTASVAAHQPAPGAPRLAVALLGAGLLLTLVASALIVPRRAVKAPALARR